MGDRSSRSEVKGEQTKKKLDEKLKKRKLDKRLKKKKTSQEDQGGTRKL